MAYGFLSARDGEYCLVGIVLNEKCAGGLQIDHADNNHHNWDPENLHLVCQKHNLALRKLTRRQHSNLIRKCSAKNERERKKTKANIPGEVVNALVDYSSGSPEMQVNSLCKQKFEDWVIELLNKHGQWPKKDVINSGALVSSR